jgi:hypothetical protein
VRHVLNRIWVVRRLALRKWVGSGHSFVVNLAFTLARLAVFSGRLLQQLGVAVKLVYKGRVNHLLNLVLVGATVLTSTCLLLSGAGLLPGTYLLGLSHMFLFLFLWLFLGHKDLDWHIVELLVLLNHSGTSVAHLVTDL